MFPARRKRAAKTAALLLVVVLIGGLGIAKAAGLIIAHHARFFKLSPMGSLRDGHGGEFDACGGHVNLETGAYHYHRGPYC